MKQDNNNKVQKSRRVRGTATFDPTEDTFSFKPFNEGESTQKDVKTCASGGKRWTTTGADPSVMFTLKVKEASPDKYAEVLQQFQALTRDMKPKKPVAMPDNMRVVNEEGLQCWLNEKSGEVTYTGRFNLNTQRQNWQAEVLRQVQLVVRRLPANERFFSLFNKIIKNV